MITEPAGIHVVSVITGAAGFSLCDDTDGMDACCLCDHRERKTAVSVTTEPAGRHIVSLITETAGMRDVPVVAEKARLLSPRSQSQRGCIYIVSWAELLNMELFASKKAYATPPRSLPRSLTPLPPPLPRLL